jgi:hypothetical protein
MNTKKAIALARSQEAQALVEAAAAEDEYFAAMGGA